MVKRVIGAICTICAVFVLNSSAVTFAEGQTKFSVDVADTVLELNVPASAVINLTPTFAGGVFGSTNLNLFIATNNSTGYSIVMNVPNTDLTHTEIQDDTPVIPTLATSAPESSFPANAWGYKVVGDNYNPVLTSNNPSTWDSDEPTNGVTHTLTLAAKVDATQVSGSYETTLIFQAVTKPTIAHDTISFNKNADGATGSMGDISIDTGTSANLPANTFAYDGYRFVGWSTTASGSGMVYSDQSQYTVPNTITNRRVTLYAIWVSNDIPDMGGSGSGGATGTSLARAYEIAYTRDGKGLYVPNINPETGEYNGTYSQGTQASDYEGIPASDLRFALQDMTRDICESVTIVNDTLNVLDVRDGKTYTIGRMADWRCWTLENLALDVLNSNVLNGMDETNTNATNDVLNHYRSGNGNSSDRWATSRPTNWTASGASFSDAWLNTSHFTDVDIRGYKYGGYYNFCAASAGSYCYGSGGNSAGSPEDRPGTDIDSQYDICPYGWRMPTGGPNGENLYIQNVYGYGNFITAFRLSYSGIFWYGWAQATGTGGGMWTSTRAADNMMMYYSWHTGRNSGTGTAGRNYGYPVRCINRLEPYE